MEQLVRDLCEQRQKLARLLSEASAAVTEHHDAWHPRRDERLDSLPWLGPDDPRRAIEFNRRLEGYYLGQAVALNWVIQWLDTTLQRHAAQAAGRVFSCPVLWPTNSVRSERTRHIPVSYHTESGSDPNQAEPTNAAN